MACGAGVPLCHQIRLENSSDYYINIFTLFSPLSRKHCAHRAGARGWSSGCAEHPGVPQGSVSPSPSLFLSLLLAWEGAQQGCATSVER